MATLVTQNEPVENVLLGTLASRTALQIAADFSAITATFLMKRVRYLLYLTDVTADEGPFCVALAQGDTSAVEASRGVTEGNTAGPSDRTQMLTQDESWNIVQDSLEFLEPTAGVADWSSDGDWHVLGGGKGIPFPEGAGWQAVIINLDADALTTASQIKGVIQYQGVWLRD